MRYAKHKDRTGIEPPVLTVQLSHKIVRHPNEEQVNYFNQTCGTERFTWNCGLAEWNQRFCYGKKPNAYSLKREFNAIRCQQYPTDIHKDAHVFKTLDMATEMKSEAVAAVWYDIKHV
jgi:hypothetical protein